MVDGEIIERVWTLRFRTPALSGVPRGWFGGVQTPPPKFRRYRWSPRSHEQEEPASRFPL